MSPRPTPGSKRNLGAVTIEPVPIDLAGDAVVVPETADPASSVGRLSVQRLDEFGCGRNFRRAAADRIQRRRVGEQMNVVVVESREQGTALCVEYALAWVGLQCSDVRNTSVFDT